MLSKPSDARMTAQATQKSLCLLQDPVKPVEGCSRDELRSIPTTYFFNMYTHHQIFEECYFLIKNRFCITEEYML